MFVIIPRMLSSISVNEFTSLKSCATGKDVSFLHFTRVFGIMNKPESCFAERLKIFPFLVFVVTLLQK